MLDSFEIDESLAGRCENFGVLFNKLEPLARPAMMIIMTNEKIVAPNSIIRFVLVGMLL